MKFSLSWLKEYLETDASLEDILAKLNSIGLEVDTVENPADAVKPFVIVDVLDAQPHPDADKLRVCQVTDGIETSQIVCGAPNARKGMKAVLGKPGTYVPGADITLRVSKIRGVESSGMMCSARELQLGDEHDGILDLPADAPTGVSYADYAGLDDPVVDIELTPNRQDCTGIYGIARDLAAAGLGTLKPLAIPTFEEQGACPVGVTIADSAAKDCAAFYGRAFTGVKNGESPDWLKQRLTSVGLRPISTLVDITNYMTMAFGRPLHVYDINRLKGVIHVRHTEAGEQLDALDDKTYKSEVGGEVAITDDSGLIGYGGIIGGTSTGCEFDTTDVFLELAFFDPVTTAKSGRRLGIHSDARYRFERGVDPGFMDDGLAIASQMILDLCGGSASEAIRVGTPPDTTRTIDFRPERVATLGGLDVAADQSADILTRLGFGVEKGDVMKVTSPTWRRDVEGEADIVEEVLRIYGYDDIPSVQLPPRDVGTGTLTTKQKRARAVRRTLAGEGLNEVLTWSFMARDKAQMFGGGADDLVIDNPIASDLNTMRPSILPNLLEAAQRNTARGQTMIALFEVGPQYRDDTETGEDLVATGIRAGLYHSKTWDQDSAEVCAYDAKRDAVIALEAAGAPVQNLMVFEEAPDYFHPTRKGTLRLGPKNILAAFGELHPKLLTDLGVDGPVVGFEVYLDKIPGARKADPSRGAYQPSNLQAVTRDFAFVVPKDMPAFNVLKAVRAAEKKHITDVTLFDIYEGTGLGDDEKSLALSVRLEPTNETFTDEVLDKISSAIVTSAEKAGARLRG